MNNTQGLGYGNLILIVVFILLIYFMMIRPQRKKDKADREMRASLAVGDEVITIGGVIGRIEKITEKTIVISTGGAAKNKIEFLKTAIGSVSKGESRVSETKKDAKEEPKVEEAAPSRDKKVTPKKLGKKTETSETEEEA